MFLADISPSPSRNNLTRSIATFCLIVSLAPVSGRAGQGFRFSDVTGSTRFFSFPTRGGHGIQCADATGDGWVDLYVTNIFEPTGNRRELFFVNSGHGDFHEQAIQAGVEDDGFHRGVSEESHAAVFADFDNDGDYDLFNAHTFTGNHRLYRNDGSGVFTDVSRRDGIDVDELETRGVAVGDVNGDGLLDIVLSAWANRPMRLYLNRGRLRFKSAKELDSIATQLSNQGIMLVDYDGDGDLDLVATGHTFTNPPTGPIAVLRNDGRGHFVDVTESTGIAFERDGLSNDGTNGWSFGDLDGDTDLDAVLVGPNRSEVYANIGGGSYRVQQVLPEGGYTALLGDLDHDSDLDIYIAGTPTIYRNNGRIQFEATTDVGLSGIGNDPRGGALADIDGDGDLDIVVVSKRGPNTLFRNDLNNSNWLQVELIGPRGDAGAFGAKVYVYDSRHVDEPAFLRGFREARGATGYCSQNSPVLHFGVPGHRPYDVKAVYPDGTFFIAKGVEAPGKVVIDPNAPLTSIR